MRTRSGLWIPSKQEKMLGHFIMLWLIFHEISFFVTGKNYFHDRTDKYSVARTSLDKPNITSWELAGHYLIINWKHLYSNMHHQVRGYYVLLCRLVDSHCAGPDFVNFNNSVRTGQIVGLAPEAIYQVEVIAYTAEEHVSSDLVTVNTRRLEFLLARNLTVSQVTCCSALFGWKHEPKNNIHDVDFLLYCTGKRQYTNIHKQLVVEEHIFDHSSPSTSKDTQILFSDKLEPNTVYLCTMSSVSGTIQSPASQQIMVSSLPGSPSTPPTPALTLGMDKTFSASIYPTDERFGTISHYLLLAVPVAKSSTDPLTAPYQPIVPLKNLLYKALSSKTVRTVSQPLPFIVTSFEPADLPVNYKFGYAWRSVFKQKTHYSVVLAAFTNGTKSNGLHSFSALSSPVYINEDLVKTWLEKQRPVAKRFTIIVVSCIFVVVILFTIVFLILFISNYYYAKCRDAKADDDILDSSDEEELFCKDNPVTSSRGARAQAIPASKGGHKGKLRALSEKSPNMTHADWAMENMCRTPAFREMIQKHPEALAEMDDVMTKIGHKWEQYDVQNTDLAHNHHVLSDSSFSEPIYSSYPRHSDPHQHHHHYHHHSSEFLENFGEDEMSDVDLTGHHYF